VIIGTAGHIDHGKSTLVTALTGRTMDRLAEERRRGITIELGFAPLELEGLQPIGIVDVPGHEDFVRTMVAGASGIDLVLLVVDAQEGIRPQTLEHLVIAEQLGIPAGIPVLTKADLADPEWLELVKADLTDRLARSPVRFEEPAVVSAVSGRGIAELRNRIRAAALRLLPRAVGDLFRLPVDRAFSIAGVGTVVTGTLWSGTIRVGDMVRLEPGGVVTRVRSVESFGRPVEAALPGSRTAIGLTGVDRSLVARGQVLLAEHPAWAPTRILDGLIRLLPEAPRPLATRTRVRFHHGTGEVMARVYPRTVIEPGTSGLARLVLEAPALVRGGDRFVLRSYSPATTIGGGTIVDPEPPRRAPWPGGLAAPDPAERLMPLIERRVGGLARADLPVLLGTSASQAGALVSTVSGIRAVGDRLVTASSFEAARTTLLDRVDRFHRDEPAAPGISLETLRQVLGSAAWMADTALQTLAGQGSIQIADGLVARAGFNPRSAGGATEVGVVVEAVRAGGLEGLSTSELAGTPKVRDLSGALRIAASQGLVEAVERDRFVSTNALREFTEVLKAVGQGAVEISPGAMREKLGLSRKYLIPLLEWADRKGITVRDHAGRRTLRN
jgi:selenocysteine-specific elongation factor